jgi:predicted Zn-ribbon and HTH transcriptional regulator
VKKKEIRFVELAAFNYRGIDSGKTTVKQKIRAHTVCPSCESEMIEGSGLPVIV